MEFECSKVRHGSKREADELIASIKKPKYINGKRQKRRNNKGIPKRSYLCECGYWHTTKRPAWHDDNSKGKK